MERAGVSFGACSPWVLPPNALSDVPDAALLAFIHISVHFSLVSWAGALCFLLLRVPCPAFYVSLHCRRHHTVTGKSQNL